MVLALKSIRVDWEKYKSLWMDKGGVWITHRSAAETADELTLLGL